MRQNARIKRTGYEEEVMYVPEKTAQAREAKESPKRAGAETGRRNAPTGSETDRNKSEACSLVEKNVSLSFSKG